MAYKAQDLINIEKVLVEDVLPFYNNELNISASPFLEKVKKTKLRADEARFGARIGIGGGFGMSRERQATPQANAPIYENFQITSKDAYVDMRISEKTIRLGRGDPGALLDAVMDNVQASYDAAKWNVGRMAFGDGTGILAHISATASATNVITVDDTSKLMVGLTVDVYKYATAGATDGTLDAAHSALQILSIDHNNKKVTLSANVTTSTAQTTSSTYGFLTVQNSYKREITGLGAIFAQTGTLYGLSKATNPIIVPRSIDADNDIDDVKLTNAVRWANRVNGVKVDLIMAGDKAFEAYEKYMRSSNQSIVEKRTFHGGAVGYDIVTGNQITTIVNEQFVPSTKMWGVDTSTFELRETGWDYCNHNSQAPAFTLQAGTSEYRALLANYMELICYNPGGCVELYDCDAKANAGG